MDSVAWTAGERPVVGVLADDARDASRERNRESDPGPRIDDAIAPAIDAHDGSSVAGRPDDVDDVLETDPAFLIAVGDRALSAIVRTDVDRPVLPVDIGPGIETVPRTALPTAVGAVLDGEAVERSRPLLTATLTSGGADLVERALFDVTLVTDEPAHISEYAVASRGERTARFRADGVVVATPAGTRGYASAVSAPELSPAVDAVAVAPIAPFVTHANRWVLPDDALSLSIEREGDDVSVSVDGRTVETIGAETRVEVAADASLSILSVPGGPG